jgi:drug/metabolite transporter (DMT)-like permease
LRGIVGFIALFFYFWALPQIDLGTAVMLNYTAPIFAVLASLILGHEKISNSVKSIIAVAFAGVYLLISPHWDIKPAPMLAGLLSGCLAGIVHVLIRQTPKEEKPLMIIFYFTVSSTVGSCLMLGHFPWVGPTMKEWFWLALVTVSSFGGQVLLTHSLKSAPVSVVSPFGYITPVLGMLIGWLIWKESPTAMSLVGSAVVIGCGFLLYRKHS